MIGKTLGNFQIMAQIGKGGMGEVYRAKDLKLGREAAIKVLPEEFAKDADRVARFQREAKLLASLNHPNIAAIYGLEESDGIQFLVLELIEGDTLADRIKAGPIQVEESLKLALQIAEALEAAHEKGVIHRDLKPANIKITPDGKVKVLDFGLAKAYVGGPSDVTLSYSPTLSDAATQQGVILGTAAYMPPEQAKGKTVDKRADIWAFGVVLFEMLTGQQLFTGETVSEILASVLKSEPDWKRLPPNLHPGIRFLLEGCIEKEPQNRCRDIADARMDIQRVLADPGGVLVESVAAAKPRKQLRLGLAWVAAAVLFSLIVGAVAVWKMKPSEPRQVTRFVHYLAQDQQFANQPFPFLAISPDGRKLAYSTTAGLFLRSMDELDATRISIANEDTAEPFFSPDGRWVGYWSLTENRLKKASVSGGVPLPLCDIAGVQVTGAYWGADDTILYCETGKGIMRISASGGIPETLIPSKNETLYHPRLMPDGKSVMFTCGSAPYQIAVQSIDSGERKVLFPGDCAWYVPVGYIIYVLDYDLYAAPFDLDTLQAGSPVLMISGLFRSNPGAPQYAVSSSGSLLYVPGAATTYVAGNTLVWVDRDGREEPVETASTTSYGSLKISPDGRRVAFSATTGGNEDIWIWDLTRKTPSRLTFDDGQDSNPLWTPDGKRVLFHTARQGGNGGVYWKAANGTGKDEPVIGSALPGMLTFPLSWAGDGRTLVLMEYSYSAGIESTGIGALAMEGDRKYRSLIKEKYTVYQPQISPDGRWMAHVSNESGLAQIYVCPFPEVDAGRWQISTSGGNSPLWSPEGRELFYRSGNAVMAVPVKTEPTFSFEASRVLFRGSYLSLPNRFLGATISRYRWDVSPDGKRFLMIKEARAAGSDEAGPRRIIVILNWLEELKQQVPVK